MKKGKVITSLVLTLALVLSLTAVLAARPINAAETDQQVTVKTSALKKAEVDISIEFGGIRLNVNAFKVSGKLNGKKKTIIYIPVAPFAEYVQMTYRKIGRKVSITSNEANIKLKFKTGKDNYTYYTLDGSADPIGPVSFGKAYVKNDLVYVPFEALEAVAARMNIKATATLEGKTLSLGIEYGSSQQDEVIDGGWSKNESVAVSEKVAELFSKATKNLTGFEITPVANLATQVVAGTNYKLLCRGKAVVPGAEEVYVFVTLYEDLQGNAQITEIQRTKNATNINDLPGGWFQAESVDLTPEMKAGFELAKAQLVGVEYKPVAILASQVVAGMNYCILCESKGVYPGATEQYSLVNIYVGFDQSVSLGEISVIEYDE